MKTTQYVNAERLIVGADGGGIRQRWLYGLRLLRDPQAMSEAGASLRHGVTAELIAAAERRGLKLSARELRYRLQCARAYPTESQIGNAVADFGTWHDLVAAGFPPYEAAPDEPPADYRTQIEKDHARAQQLMLHVGPQGTLFPIDEFEPTQVTLLELHQYADEQAAITQRFVKRDRDRYLYLRQLDIAVKYDMTTTWQAAHDLAYGTDEQAA